MRNYKELTDAELLDIVGKSAGLTNDTKTFKEKFDVDCSYTSITNELKCRGYSQDWHKVEQTDCEIKLAVPEDKYRQTFFISKQVADAWKEKFGAVKGNAALVEAALKRFMSDVDEGKIIIRF